MSVSKILREVKKRVKKFMGKPVLNSRQERLVKNAMDTLDQTQVDAGNKNLRGATKRSAIISNQRMNRMIERIAEDKSKTQTDAVNAILQGTGIGFLIGLDTTLNNKKTTSKTKKTTTTTKTPPKPKPNPRRVSKPKPKPNPRIERANRSMLVKSRRNK
tara:strand:+ start:81 stop:557 length:477 start_codon:yes stop_codon:yes gene_type:complete